MAVSNISYPLLAIDAASAINWVGIKLGSQHLLSTASPEDPTRCLFQLVENALEQASLQLASIQTIVYCEGPGSMLGVRTAAMAIRAWEGVGLACARNLFSYNCLRMGALLAAKVRTSIAPALLVTDARRNAWNTLPYPPGDNDPQITENETLEASNLPKLTLSGFARVTKSTATFDELPYDLDQAFSDEAFLDAIRPTPFAAPLVLRQNEYLKWTPGIHRAASQS